ncbi:kinase-like protein [Coemansia reversa NRRL 1564]|uniref:non-specific serine/threonine protein kinase n=1 Tax=Coemansia reversa (strain ATCC 12441 / NRRL 1564) TaxID=763665 RepID=A0A2G5BKJ5_COERN|nr:kinase-like protein [Coemansia reversa NRRL 1564]|eukprot:PIA19277.1 kinase-like protein [Coemansia reversa NRRL 1564]
MEVQHDPRTGRKMINQYMIIRELGRGTHGKVKLAFDTASGEYYAIKVIDKEPRGRRLRPGPGPLHGRLRIDVDKMEKVKREIAILKKCRHPNVVRLREVIDDAHARRIYLVIEYMDGGEIAWRDADHLPLMTTDRARCVFRGLVLGVEYLHYVGILHRDLKPQNLLCSKAGAVKISDFGVSFLSRKMSKHRLDHAASAGPADEERELAKTAGTPAFFAPELCYDEVDQPLPTTLITPSIDIWAMGVTLYCFIYGRVPFQATTEFELFNIIPRQPLKFPQHLDLAPLDPDLRDLLSRMLDKDFRTRITIDEIKHHPWVVKDLDHPNSWAKETDPACRPSLTITSQEVEHAMVPKLRQRRGFRATVRHRISMLSPLTSKNQRQQQQQQQQHLHQLRLGTARTKSSLDWLKIWQ